MRTRNQRLDPEVIQAEIAALKELKPKVKRTSFFGDDNHAAIDAQIQVLEDDLDTADARDIWGEEGSEQNDVLLMHARDAIDWRDGEATDDGSPSDGWKELVS